MMRRSYFLVMSLALCYNSSLASQTVLAGFVREDSTDRPIQGVEIVIEGTGRRATTDALGKFVFPGLSAGVRIALFRSVGWRPVRLSVNLAEGDTVWTEATMVRALVELAPLEVTGGARRAHGLREGVVDRRKLGFGRFLDSSLIRASEHLRLSDLLRRVDGISLVRRGSSMFAMSIRRPGCFMQVILDGRVLYRPFAPTSQDTVGNPPPDLTRDFDIPALESVEVYRSAAETPSEFGGSGAACGTVVLWTRRSS